MKLLIVGSGGREHALGWKLKQSPLVDELIAAPGNPGLEALGRCVAIKAENASEIAAFAAREQVGGVALALVAVQLLPIGGRAGRWHFGWRQSPAA